MADILNELFMKMKMIMILVLLTKKTMISVWLIKMIMILVLLMKMRAEWWDHQSSQHPPLMNLQHILPLTTLCSVHITLNAMCSVHTTLNAMCSVHTTLTTLCVLLLTKVCTPLQALPFIVFLLTASHTHHPLPLNKLAHKTFFVTQLFCCTNAHFYHTSRISHTLIFTLDAAEKNHYHINTNSILLSQFAVHLLWRRPASNVAEKGERIFEGHCILRGFGVGWYMEHMRYMGLAHGVHEVHEVGTWSVSTFVGHQGRSQWLKKLWPGIISDCHPSCRLRNLLFFSSLVWKEAWSFWHSERENVLYSPKIVCQPWKENNGNGERRR